MDAGVPELRLLNRTKESAVNLGVAFTPSDGRRIVIDRWEERSAALDSATLLGHDAQAQTLSDRLDDVKKNTPR